MIDNQTKIKLILNKHLITDSFIYDICEEYWNKPENETGGGHYHVFLEDGNAEDNQILFCLERSIQFNDTDGILLGLILLRVPKERRDPYDAEGRGYSGLYSENKP